MAALAVARNTLMLYDINKDPKKEDSPITIETFLPHPSVFLDDNHILKINVSPKTARRFLRELPESKPYVHYAINNILKDLQVISRR